MDVKRQNKLLKLAIGRLQNELERKEEITSAGGGGKTFLTDGGPPSAGENKAEKLLEMLKEGNAEMPPSTAPMK